jgi:hypothetical protein
MVYTKTLFWPVITRMLKRTGKSTYFGSDESTALAGIIGLNGGRSPINSRQIPLFSPINQFWSRIPPHFPMVVIKQSHCGNPTTIGSMQPNNPPNNVVGELDPNKTLQVEPAHHQNQSGCGKTVFFGVSSSYVPDWDTRAAFRELYQNWSVLCRHLLNTWPETKAN